MLTHTAPTTLVFEIKEDKRKPLEHKMSLFLGDEEGEFLSSAFQIPFLNES